MLLLVCFSSYSLSAKQVVNNVEEVEIDSRIVRFISALVEYESGCEFYSQGYPKDNILSLSMRRSPLSWSDTAKLVPVVEFYPDLIRYHECANVRYVAHVNIGDSTYNVYIVMYDDDEHLWPKEQFPFPIKPTGSYSTIIKTEVTPYGEYDPPYIRIWYITNKYKTKQGFYVEDGFSNYCW